MSLYLQHLQRFVLVSTPSLLRDKKYVLKILSIRHVCQINMIAQKHLN